MNIARNIATNVQPLQSDAAERYKKGVEEQLKCLNEMQKCNFKQQFNVMAVSSQEELQQLCAQVSEQCATQNVLIEMEKSFINKLVLIESGANVNDAEVNNLSNKSATEVSTYKLKFQFE